MHRNFLENKDYLDSLYKDYLNNPATVDPNLKHFFDGVTFASSHSSYTKPSPLISSQDISVYQLIQEYKRLGHYKAKTNPLSHYPIIGKELSLEAYGLDKMDPNTLVPTFSLMPEHHVPFHTLLDYLKKIYMGSIGFEYMHIVEAPKIIEHIDHFIEHSLFRPLDSGKNEQVFELLYKAESFEQFLQKRHLGKKRFSLEGCEALIPMLEGLIDLAAKERVNEIIFGMAHRGRLNVLANILHKEMSQIFYEFEPEYIPHFSGNGDVKYHMGFSKLRKQVHLTLAPNPSHLESINPVILGMARAKMDKIGHSNILPVTIHGDAALAGQGVVYESLQGMLINGYDVKGSIHIVINNQVGFTASSHETRSTPYATDIAKAFDLPIFHVNAYDPFACMKVMELAFEIRQKFHRDVFIDLIGFRRHGHNEGDEPAFTQPLMTKAIKTFETISSRIELPKEREKAIKELFDSHLEKAYEDAKRFVQEPNHSNIKPFQQEMKIDTSLFKEHLSLIKEKMVAFPPDFQVHPRLKKILEERVSREKIDWGLAEHLAFSELLLANIPIRLSGEDCKRGTFSHRHIVLIDQETEKPFCPINHLKNGQEKIQVFNSYLSEYAVMGYEFGYTLANPKALVLWEAQFGDFTNGAEIIIDQYLSSSETKWERNSGLVLLLPHGFEGGGPEHSSARIERFLEMSADNNWTLIHPTTTAQLFHALKKQGLTAHKRPLIIFMPKSYLRDESSFSHEKELLTGTFQPILVIEEVDKVDTCVFASGKVALDIEKERKNRNVTNLRVIRIEQIYPFPKKEIEEALKGKKQIQRFCFVQEEPKNMGPYPHLRSELEELVEKPIHYIGRRASSSPATGSAKISLKETEAIMKELFLR